jgi:PPOX class probable F420-dependent enzyme
MTRIPGSHRYLLGADFATLATIGPDQVPQLSELWFLAEIDDVIRLSLNTARRKVKNLQRNPACSLLLLDLGNPHRYLEIRGHAELTPDPDLAFADKVGTEYGADLRVMDRPGDSHVITRHRHGAGIENPGLGLAEPQHT